MNDNSNKAQPKLIDSLNGLQNALEAIPTADLPAEYTNMIKQGLGSLFYK